MQKTAPLKKHKKIYAPIIIALIFLFNPNISVVDVLPDFIGFIILARVFIRASDSAPYFEEARIAFKRLAWLNFFKLFGIIAIASVKRQNFSDNDIIPLVTLTFAICEAIISTSAVRNIFDALFHIGERTTASATIIPFRTLGTNVRMSPDSLKIFNYFFVIFKCAIAFLPTLFLLSRVNPIGSSYVKITVLFPIVLVGSHIIGIIVGAIWLFLMIKYVSAIHKQSLFFDGLDFVFLESRGTSLEHKEKMRKIGFALSAFTVASVFTLELTLVESYDVNLLPHFIYGIILLFACRRLLPYAANKTGVTVSGILYILSSLAAYIFETRFLIEFGYGKLLTSSAAREAYPLITLLSGIELFLLILFLINVFITFRHFYRAHTGIGEDTVDLPKNESYYGSIKNKCIIMTALGILSGASKFISVLMHGMVKTVFTDPNDVTRPTIIAPSVEWIGLVVTVCSFAYIFATAYFISTLKEEVKMRYEKDLA